MTDSVVTQADREAAVQSGFLEGWEWPEEAVLAGEFDSDPTVLGLAQHRTQARLEGERAGMEKAARMLDQAIADGYPGPLNKVDQCAHGKFGWEDCIACYDEKLTECAAAIRNTGATK